MTSSGIKRGVAASAISALAVAGLPLFAGTASAEPNTAQYAADTVSLLSQFSGSASTKNDGQNTTVRLEAGAGTGVSSVTFQYNTNNPDSWITAGVATRNDDGAFSFEWNASALNGATVDLRAYETGTDPDATADTRDGVTITGAGVAADSVNLNDGSAHGYFAEPYSGDAGDQAWTVLRGTGSGADEDGAVDLVAFPEVGDGEDPEEFAPADLGSADLADGEFAGIVDIFDADYSFVGSPDEISFGAEDDSDDVEAYTLYAQTITEVTAEAEDTTVPAGGSVDVTVTVTDQNGAPIAGAEVFSSNAAASDPDSTTTDENGEATFTQGGGTAYYYANATDGDAYQAGLGDQRSGDITVTEFNAAPTSLEADSVDGEAFDFDEYVDGDITVQVQNQNGGDADTDGGQTLNYHWVITPFDEDEDQVRVPADEDTESEATGVTDGSYDIEFPAGQPEGSYELFASLSEVPVEGGGDIAESSVLTVKAGQSDVVYDDASPENAPAGTTEEVTGSLELVDGTGLGGRGLNFDYNSVGGDATIEEDSGTADDGDVITDADGGFAFDVVDPEADPQNPERGSIDVTAVNATEDDDNVGAIDNQDQEVVFAAAEAPDDSEITLGGDTGTDAPGDVKDVTVTIDDTEGVGGDPVANTLVTLTTDEGFFTNEAGTADLGDEVEVATDDSGEATAYLSIERNEGFDDDGDVTSMVTATSGDNTGTEDYEWSTDGTETGTVDLVLSDDQTVTVLPMAPWETEDVNMDVFAYDEFGNPIDEVEVTVEGDFVNADDATTEIGVETDLANNGDVTVSQTSAGDEEYTATWEDAVVTDDGDEDATDSETVEWYDINVAEATVEAAGSSPHAVGSTVTMTYTAIDQNGEPIDGYDVEFYRAGPDDTNTGEAQATRETNAMGEAYYVFQGEVAGTATVSTVLYDTDENIVPDGAASTDVKFGTAKKVNPNAKLDGKNNGGKPKDKLQATGKKAAEGATVALFKIKKNGKKFIVATKTANAKGNANFRVNDRNGKKKTTYKVVYRSTDATKKDGSNKVTVR